MTDFVYANGDTVTYQDGTIATAGHSTTAHVDTNDRVIVPSYPTPKAMMFDGVNSEVRSRADGFKDDVDSDRQFTISAWFKVDEVTTGRHTIFQITTTSTSSNNSYRLGTDDPEGYLWFSARTSTGQNQFTTNVVTPGKWHHAFATSDGSSDRRLNLDNGPTSTSAVIKTVSTTMDNAIIGMDVDGSNPFPGAIAHVALWGDDVLDASEREALANGASPLTIRPERLTAYWPLNTTDAYVLSYRYLTDNNLMAGADGGPIGLSSGPGIPADYHPRIQSGPQTQIITTPETADDRVWIL